MPHVPPVSLLRSRLRVGAYDGLTLVPAPPPPKPVVSILTPFTAVDRSASSVVTQAVRLTRTSPTEAVCQVNWAITAFGSSPVTGSYFVGGVLPSGTATFNPGETFVDVNIQFSSGTKPSVDLSGVFTISATADCTVSPASYDFQFRILQAASIPGDWSWAEPTWIPVVPYASAPGKVQLTVAGDLNQLATMSAGQSFVFNGTINGGGNTYTVSGTGTAANPIRLIPNGAIGNATLTNCRLVFSNVSYVLMSGLNLEGVIVEIEGTNNMVQFERNELCNYVAEGGTKGAFILKMSASKYIRWYGNEFLSKAGKPFNRTGISSNVISPATSTNYYKYIWIERNLFQDFTLGGDGKRHFSWFIGQANPDANKNVYLTIKDNLVKDSMEPATWEIKLCGNARILGNTFERSSSAPPAFQCKLRFGSIKVRTGTKPTGALVSAHGALVAGNLFVTPDGTSITAGRFLVKDFGHKFINNWGVKLGPTAQPNLSSPLNEATIGLGFGNLDSTWWPEIEPDIPELNGRMFGNSGYCEVGGNRMGVEVGSQENALKTGETMQPSRNNIVAPTTVVRGDRNASVTLYPDGKQVGTNQTMVISGADYNSIPVRILPSSCGRSAP